MFSQRRMSRPARPQMAYAGLVVLMLSACSRDEPSAIPVARVRDSAPVTFPMASATPVCAGCTGRQHAVDPGFGGGSPWDIRTRWFVGEPLERLRGRLGPCQMRHNICTFKDAELDVAINDDGFVVSLRQYTKRRLEGYRNSDGSRGAKPICSKLSRFAVQVPLEAKDVLQASGEPIGRRSMLDPVFGVLEIWEYEGYEYEIDRVIGRPIAGAVTVGPLVPLKPKPPPDWWVNPVCP